LLSKLVKQQKTSLMCNMSSLQVVLAVVPTGAVAAVAVAIEPTSQAKILEAVIPLKVN
jgi:hypothetical protein